jgi:FtsH-binding integral membrane protein
LHPLGFSAEITAKKIAGDIAMYGIVQNIRQQSGALKWIWAALAVQLGGLAYDAVWHGLLHSEFEARTVDEMVNHLATVHLPIYIGVLSVLVTTAWALIDQIRRSKTGVALPVAFAGALVSTAGEIWHAYTHLQLSTHSGPIAGMTAVFGFIVVVTALWLAGRPDRRAPAHAVYERRRA